MNLNKDQIQTAGRATVLVGTGRASPTEAGGVSNPEVESSLLSPSSASEKHQSSDGWDCSRV